MGIVDYIEAKNRERIARARWEDTKKIGLGVIIGLAAGSIAGVLYAPKSGEETREDIANAAIDASKKVRGKASEMADLAMAYKEDIENRLTAIGPAIESGLSAAGKSLSESKKEVEASVKEVKESVDKAKDSVKDAAKDAKEKTEKSAKKEYDKQVSKNEK